MNLVKKIILTFILFLTITTIKVDAATSDTAISIQMIPNVYSNKETPYQNFWIQFDYLYVNGKIGYCIQPGIRITTRTYSSTLDFSSFNLSDNDKRNLELISYYGYSYPNHQTLEYYMATQELIWRYVGITNLNFTTESNYGGNVIDIEYYKNEIKRLIERHDVKPSFNGETMTGIVGDTLIYEDTNGVLNDYTIISSNNDAWIDDNKLYIRINHEGLSEIKLKKQKYTSDNSYVYLATNSQTLATFGLSEEVEANLFVNGLYKVVVNIEKQGNYIDEINDTDYQYKDKPLEGVVYNIYADEDIYESGNLIYTKDTLVEELTTTRDGQAISSLLPIGSYYLEEMQTDDNYIKDDTRYTFTFDKNNNVSGIVYQNYEFKNLLKLGNYRLQKRGEQAQVVDNQFNYILSGLADVKFGVYASEDLYNTNNELLVPKDELLFEVVTDEDGIIDIELPIGSYYIQELETPIEYEIDDTKYYFEINSDNLEVIDNIIINKLKKAKLSITKMDSDTKELLSDTVYNLYDKNEEFIMELVTNEEGKIEVELPYGKYFLKELKSKYGYLIDDNIYELNVVDEDIDLELYNQKIPMPITTDYQNNIKIISFFLFIIGALLIYASKSKNYN